MPELPDVEGERRYLARHARGRRIERVEVLAGDLARNRSPQASAARCTDGALLRARAGP